MISRLSLLFASTALTLTLGLSAVGATQIQGSALDRCGADCTTDVNTDDLSVPLVRVSEDDDHDDDADGWSSRRQEDDDALTGARGNPAPAGTVSPPANGLFGNGAPPVAVTN